MKSAKGTIAFVIVLLFGAGFMLGTAIGMNMSSRQQEEQSRSLEEYGIYSGMSEAEKLEQINRVLSAAKEEIYIEPEIYFAAADSSGEAYISNGAESSLSVKCTIIRDATGEIVYSSGLIDPGYSIKDIYLIAELKKGEYPCTVVWTFYNGNDEVLLGETACNVMTIITN